MTAEVMGRWYTSSGINTRGVVAVEKEGSGFGLIELVLSGGVDGV